MFVLIIVSICGVTTFNGNTAVLLPVTSDNSLLADCHKQVKLVLQDLDGSAIIEKYHVIKPTKGLLLLPLGSIGSPGMSELSKPQNIYLIQKCAVSLG